MLANRDPRADFVFARSVAEILPNLIYFGIGVGFIVLLGNWLRWLGILGFAVYALILLIDVVRFAFLVITGTILSVTKSGPTIFRPPTKLPAKAWGALLIQLVESSVFACYTVFLYGYFFGQT